MEDEVRQLTRAIVINGPVEETELSSAEDQLGERLPDEYRKFLLETGGGEGSVGDDGWIRFDNLEAILEQDRTAHSDQFDHFVDLAIFACDGASETFCFDRKGQVWRVNWLSYSNESVQLGSFIDFLQVEARGGWTPFER